MLFLRNIFLQKMKQKQQFWKTLSSLKTVEEKKIKIKIKRKQPCSESFNFSFVSLAWLWCLGFLSLNILEVAVEDIGERVNRHTQ